MKKFLTKAVKHANEFMLSKLGYSCDTLLLNDCCETITIYWTGDSLPIYHVLKVTDVNNVELSRTVTSTSNPQTILVPKRDLYNVCLETIALPDPDFSTTVVDITTATVIDVPSDSVGNEACHDNILEEDLSAFYVINGQAGMGGGE